jgi:hypothetical protein
VRWRVWSSLPGVNEGISRRTSYPSSSRLETFSRQPEEVGDCDGNMRLGRRTDGPTHRQPPFDMGNLGLGRKYIAAKDSILATAESVIKLGLVKQNTT